MKRATPQLLVSVRDAQEAQTALAGGANLIDVKEPGRGALGRADQRVLTQVIKAVGGQRPVSAAFGELVELPGGQLPDLPVGLTYAKVGLAGSGPDWREGLATLRGSMAPVELVVVTYADYQRARGPSVDDVLSWGCEHRLAGVLIDTAVKDGQGLFEWLNQSTLVDLITKAHSSGLMIGLSGSLRGQAIGRAASIGPDIVAIRGAGCGGGDRQNHIDYEQVRQAAGLIAACTVGGGVEGRIA